MNRFYDVKIKGKEDRIFMLFPHGEGVFLVPGTSMRDSRLGDVNVGMDAPVEQVALAVQKHLLERGESLFEVALRESKRPSWDAYFMQLARIVSERSTCDRKHVGAVIVRDRRILSTGYNGSLPGAYHCDEIGHDLVELADGSKNCVRTVHAEVNAVTQAAQFGLSVKGAAIYTNTFPCWNCFKTILAAGLKNIFYADGYRIDDKVLRAATDADVEIVKVA